MIGIVGGIGSGKSTVIRHVRRFRLLIIDADEIAHERLKDPAIRDRIRFRFGSAVLTPDGQVDRAKLAGLVFGPTAEHDQARRDLEQILHPAVRKEAERKISEASQDADAVILDAALLLEAGWADDCDALIFIETPLSVRQERVQRNRNWSAAELARREASQISPEEKKLRAGFVVDNSGSPEEAARQLEQHLTEIIHPVI